MCRTSGPGTATRSRMRRVWWKAGRREAMHSDDSIGEEAASVNLRAQEVARAHTQHTTLRLAALQNYDSNSLAPPSSPALPPNLRNLSGERLRTSSAPPAPPRLRRRPPRRPPPRAVPRLRRPPSSPRAPTPPPPAACRRIAGLEQRCSRRQRPSATVAQQLAAVALAQHDVDGGVGDAEGRRPPLVARLEPRPGLLRLGAARVVANRHVRHEFAAAARLALVVAHRHRRLERALQLLEPRERLGRRRVHVEHAALAAAEAAERVERELKRLDVRRGRDPRQRRDSGRAARTGTRG